MRTEAEKRVDSVIVDVKAAASVAVLPSFNRRMYLLHFVQNNYTLRRFSELFSFPRLGGEPRLDRPQPLPRHLLVALQPCLDCESLTTIATQNDSR